MILFLFVKIFPVFVCFLFCKTWSITVILQMTLFLVIIGSNDCRAKAKGKPEKIKSTSVKNELNIIDNFVLKTVNIYLNVNKFKKKS